MTKLWAAKSCPKPHKCFISILWSHTLAMLMIQREADSLGTLPDASQEGLLYQFKSYSNVALFHYNVPSEVTRATWEFAAFQDDPSCPSRKVHIYLQHGAYPVFNGYFENNKNITLVCSFSLHCKCTTIYLCTCIWLGLVNRSPSKLLSKFIFFVLFFLSKWIQAFKWPVLMVD